MQFRHEVVELGNSQREVRVYLEGLSTEFARELGSESPQKQQWVLDQVANYVRENVSDLTKNTAIKVMMGAIVIGGMTVGNVQAKAADLPKVQKSQKKSNAIRVTINGKELTFDQPPYLKNNRTMVPVHNILDALGATVSWDAASRTVTARHGNDIVTMKIGEDIAYVNGQAVLLDVPAELSNDRTMVPVHFLSEAFGATVSWEPSTQTVVIENSGQPQTSTIPATIPTNASTPANIPDHAGTPDLAVAAIGQPGVPSVNNLLDLPGNHALVKQQMLADAKKYLGVHYVWGGATPSGFDCSGFVHYLFDKHGVPMPRLTSIQLSHTGVSVDKSHLQPGDLVFFAVHKPGVVTHVGFYLGNNEFISATSSKGIAIASLNNPYWAPHYFGAKRVY